MCSAALRAPLAMAGGYIAASFCCCSASHRLRALRSPLMKARPVTWEAPTHMCLLGRSIPSTPQPALRTTIHTCAEQLPAHVEGLPMLLNEVAQGCSSQLNQLLRGFLFFSLRTSQHSALTSADSRPNQTFTVSTTAPSQPLSCCGLARFLQRSSGQDQR